MKFILIALVSILMFACSNMDEKIEIINKYSDGKPRVLEYYKNDVFYKTIMLSQLGDTIRKVLKLPNSNNFIMYEFDNNILEKKMFFNENQEVFLKYEYVQDTTYLIYNLLEEDIIINLTYFKNKFLWLKEEILLKGDLRTNTFLFYKNDSIDDRKSIYVSKKNNHLKFTNLPKHKTIYFVDDFLQEGLTGYEYKFDLEGDSLFLSQNIEGYEMIICSQSFDEKHLYNDLDNFIYYYPLKYNIPDTFNIPKAIITEINNK